MGDPKVTGSGSINEPDAPNELPAAPQSVNEPVQPAPPVEPEAEPKDPLPSDSELNAMTRAELDELAEERGIDSTEAATKADVIAMLKDDAE